MNPKHQSDLDAYYEKQGVTWKLISDVKGHKVQYYGKDGLPKSSIYEALGI